jgi:hypothetical protein
MMGMRLAKTKKVRLQGRNGLPDNQAIQASMHPELPLLPCAVPQVMPAGVLTGTGLLGLYYHYQKMNEWS